MDATLSSSTLGALLAHLATMAAAITLDPAPEPKPKPIPCEPERTVEVLIEPDEAREEADLAFVEPPPSWVPPAAPSGPTLEPVFTVDDETLPRLEPMKEKPIRRARTAGVLGLVGRGTGNTVFLRSLTSTTTAVDGLSMESTVEGGVIGRSAGGFEIVQKMAPWRERVARAIMRHRLWNRASRDEAERAPRLLLTVGRGGKLLKSKILRSSGSEALDAAALAAARKARLPSPDGPPATVIVRLSP